MFTVLRRNAARVGVRGAGGVGRLPSLRPVSFSSRHRIRTRLWAGIRSGRRPTVGRGVAIRVVARIEEDMAEGRELPSPACTTNRRGLHSAEHVNMNRAFDASAAAKHLVSNARLPLDSRRIHDRAVAQVSDERRLRARDHHAIETRRMAGTFSSTTARSRRGSRFKSSRAVSRKSFARDA